LAWQRGDEPKFPDRRGKIWKERISNTTEAENQARLKSVCDLYGGVKPPFRGGPERKNGPPESARKNRDLEGFPALNG